VISEVFLQIRSYLKDILRFPLLTREEERKLFSELREKEKERDKIFVFLYPQEGPKILLQRPKRGRKGSKAYERAKKRQKQLIEKAISALREERKLDDFSEKLNLPKEEIREKIQELSWLHREINLIVERLIQSNLRLVISEALKFFPQTHFLSLEDLIQEGNIGLMRAIERYDPQKGTKFSTYAVFWIDQAIRRAIQSQDFLVYRPSEIFERKRKIEKMLKDISLEEVAQKLRKSPLEILELLSIFKSPVSLQKSLFENLSPRERKLTFEDVLLDPAPTPEEEFFEKERRKELRKIIEKLPEKQAKVIKLRYGFENGKSYSLREVGEKLGISRERVRQIETEALRNLRDFFSKNFNDRSISH